MLLWEGQEEHKQRAARSRTGFLGAIIAREVMWLMGEWPFFVSHADKSGGRRKRDETELPRCLAELSWSRYWRILDFFFFLKNICLFLWTFSAALILLSPCPLCTNYLSENCMCNPALSIYTACTKNNYWDSLRRWDVIVLWDHIKHTIIKCFAR